MVLVVGISFCQLLHYLLTEESQKHKSYLSNAASLQLLGTGTTFTFLRSTVDAKDQRPRDIHM